MSLIVEHVFGEFEQIGPLLGFIEFAQLPVVHLDFLWIVELAVVRAGHRMRQVFADIGERIDDVLAIALGGDIEVTVAQRFEPRPRRQYPLGYAQSDLAPLVDDPDSIIFIGLIDVAVEQFEAERLGSGFFEQAPRLGPRLLDIRPVTGDLLQLLLGRGERRAGEGDPADRMYDRDLGQLRCAAPAVDG